MKAVALKNRITKHQDAQNIDWEFHLRNSDSGCSGFITNNTDKKTIYVDTTPSPYGPLTDQVMFRNARGITDYTGGRNRWAERKNGAFVNDVVELATNVTRLVLQD